MSEQNICPMKIIAHIRTDFPTKFGIPRQSGLVPDLRGTVVFLPEYRNPDALRGIEGYSHLWLIWQFSEAKREGWSPTVRPPRLGGNTKMGVFATRSPYRPNPIGLSSVRLEGVERTADRGLVLHVSGADLIDGTPILDIKPYLSFTDSHPDAVDGFAETRLSYELEVDFPPHLLALVDEDDRCPLLSLLAEDPRPSYQDDPERIYGMPYGRYDVQFTVAEGCLHVCDVLFPA
ncbi:MAG: tRNA (N6-threonylcarbamoyladenosine(37)-N6)-methyltransferase TrmO [Ruminococcaceae bacterium]|nr:tRNA (N6-threonylcarbamoyladenosine(37)-N6)-methyltransferase TrmO [Oscillospiraceae bacterium]